MLATKSRKKFVSAKIYILSAVATATDPVLYKVTIHHFVAPNIFNPNSL